MFIIRCPHCHKKGAESVKDDVTIELFCHKCNCVYTYDKGVYSHKPPTNAAKMDRYYKLRYIPFQDRMNLSKK